MVCAHFFPFCRSSDGGIWRRRRVQIVFGRLTVHVPAKSKTDKTQQHQTGPGHHHPMRILHRGERISHFPFAFIPNRELPSEILRAWARALTADAVRPRSVAMSKAGALEMTSFRSRSSSSVVQYLA